MPSKIVSALAAGGLLVATSSALAQTAGSTSLTLPAVSSAALLQGGAGETRTSTALIIGGVLVSFGLLIWATGDDEEPGVSP